MSIELLQGPDAVELRLRPAPSGARPVLGRGDAWQTLGLPLWLALAWAVPERYWPKAAAGLVRLRPGAVGANLRAARRIRETCRGQLGDLSTLSIAWAQHRHRYEHYFQVLRDLRPGGWQPDIELRGMDHVEAALAGGRGAVLWVGHFVFNGLMPKMAFRAAGHPIAHLSRPEHGFSKTAYGVRVLNPVRSRVEDRYLAERVLIRDHDGAAALRRLRRVLAGNGVVSVTAGAWEGRSIAMTPLFGAGLPLATGAPGLAYAAAAPLLPLFAVAEDNRLVVAVEAPLDVPVDADRETAIRHACADYATRLEPWVRRHPGQWRGWRYLEPYKPVPPRTPQDIAREARDIVLRTSPAEAEAAIRDLLDSVPPDGEWRYQLQLLLGYCLWRLERDDELRTLITSLAPKADAEIALGRDELLTAYVKLVRLGDLYTLHPVVAPVMARALDTLPAGTREWALYFDKLCKSHLTHLDPASAANALARLCARHPRNDVEAGLIDLYRAQVDYMDGQVDAAVARFRRACDRPMPTDDLIGGRHLRDSTFTRALADRALGDLMARLPMPRPRGDLKVPSDDREIVQLIACDGQYFRRYVPIYIESLALCCRGLHVHLHLIDAEPEDWKRAMELRDRFPMLRFNFSEESTDFTSRRTYYAQARFLHLPRFLEWYGRPLLVTDCDLVCERDFRHEMAIQADGCDVVVSPGNTRMFPWQAFAAGRLFVRSGPGGRRFAEHVAKYIAAVFEPDRERGQWWLDQAALFCVTRHFDDPAGGVAIRRIRISHVRAATAMGVAKARFPDAARARLERKQRTGAFRASRVRRSNPTS